MQNVDELSQHLNYSFTKQYKDTLHMRLKILMPLCTA